MVLKKKIKIKGVIDRVDRVNGKLRIIDYKSGKCDDSKVLLKLNKTKSQEEVLIESIKKGWNFLLQLVTYLKLYKDKHAEIANEAGIISLVDLKNSPFYLTNESSSDHEDLILIYEEVIQSILEDIYAVDKPFEHSSRSNYCSFC